MKPPDLLDALVRATLRPIQGTPARSGAQLLTGSCSDDRRHPWNGRSMPPLLPVRLLVLTERRHPTR